MIKFEQSDIKFISENIPEPERILESNNLREILLILSDWISKNAWDKSGYDYSDLGRQAQRVYDNIYLNN